ncbi:uncharacterized protein LOC128732243 [Anopheles nili]|uniref:uncharacterized protein LOC128732243 n=1 Tax=Anopheles nili TaxID=185578 RepID=UPI00237A48DF|nr:uncharacterized protein LOC128732243 [Anopheles nili]
MRALKLLAVVTVCGVVGVFGCDQPLGHYKTMGCTPIGKLATGCPERYECPSITAHDNTKCYFNGKTYEITQQVPDAEVAPFCSTNCYCRSANPFAKFRCIHVGCPDFLQRFDHENCLKQYKPNSCCYTGKVCGEDRQKLATCELEKEIYREGQRMYFKENKCRSCICTAGFNANATDTDPNCFDTPCGFELFEEKHVYGGGIPVYKKDRCCPWEWRLPQASDSIVKGTAGKASTDPLRQCKYGKLTLDVGDSLNIQQGTAEAQKMTCSCAVPPLVHCVLNN